MARIAFIGLGNMGGPMAANLVRAGHDVVGFDLSPPALDAARAAGVTIAVQAVDAVRDAGFVITMLPAGAHVLRVYADLLPAAPRGTVFIDSSTIDVASARTAHTQAGQAGVRALDAPVSGGVGGATAGTLTFMVGGETQDFEAAQPILSAMGKRIVHCGEAGAGQAAKICNNMILGISMIAVSEAFVLGEKLGLSHQALFDVASTSSGQCWSLTTYCPVPGPVARKPREQRLQARLCDSADAEGPQTGAGSRGARRGWIRRSASTRRRFTPPTARPAAAEMDFSAIIADVRTRDRAATSRRALRSRRAAVKAAQQHGISHGRYFRDPAPSPPESAAVCTLQGNVCLAEGPQACARLCSVSGCGEAAQAGLGSEAGRVALSPTEDLPHARRAVQTRSPAGTACLHFRFSPIEHIREGCGKAMRVTWPSGRDVIAVGNNPGWTRIAGTVAMQTIGFTPIIRASPAGTSRKSAGEAKARVTSACTDISPRGWPGCSDIGAVIIRGPTSAHTTCKGVRSFLLAST